MVDGKILITGGNGMLGKAFNSFLSNAIYIDIDKYDLRSEKDVETLFMEEQPEYVIHCAAMVGGVYGNMENLGKFFTDNVRMNTNVLDYAHKFNVKKVVSLLSTCVYPDKVNYPLTEEQIHNGPPHLSNYTYAYTKRMLDVQSRAYREQYGCNFVCVVPNNLYGIHDNFNLEQSHVLPAIIRKIYEAKQRNKDVYLWGDGKQLREFTYASDVAQIILYVLEYYNEPEPINIGNTNEYTIRTMAEKISEIFRYDGEIVWDVSKPSGQLKKPSSNEKFKLFLDKNKIAFKYTELEVGLKSVCDWFLYNYPNVRGI